jgi:hypothetical protein
MKKKRRRRRRNTEGDVLMQNHEEKEERRKREMDALGDVADFPEEKNCNPPSACCCKGDCEEVFCTSSTS